MSGGDPAASGPDQPPLAAALSETFHDQIRNQRLPLTPEQVDEIDGDTLGVPTHKVSTHTRFFKLNNDAAWTRLTAAFESGKTANLRPWYRCIGILREHGAPRPPSNGSIDSMASNGERETGMRPTSGFPFTRSQSRSRVLKTTTIHNDGSNIGLSVGSF